MKVSRNCNTFLEAIKRNSYFQEWNLSNFIQVVLHFLNRYQRDGVLVLGLCLKVAIGPDGVKCVISHKHDLIIVLFFFSFFKIITEDMFFPLLFREGVMERERDV